MTRLFKNRQTTLIFALAATLFVSPMLSGRSFAGSVGGISEPSNPTSGIGDPDVPSTGPSRVTLSGAQKPADPTRDARTVGDGRGTAAGWASSAWTWRLRIVLQGLRAYMFRF